VLRNVIDLCGVLVVQTNAATPILWLVIVGVRHYVVDMCVRSDCKTNRPLHGCDTKELRCYSLMDLALLETIRGTKDEKRKINNETKTNERRKIKPQ
jgi:hypothetical protein